LTGEILVDIKKIPYGLFWWTCHRMAKINRSMNISEIAKLIKKPCSVVLEIIEKNPTEFTKTDMDTWFLTNPTKYYHHPPKNHKSP
jgi:hypothetical protein